MSHERREVIAALGGTAAGVALAARAQQAERMRRIGVFSNRSADDPEWQTRMAAFIRACRSWAASWGATFGSSTASVWRRRIFAPARGRAGRAGAGCHRGQWKLAADAAAAGDAQGAVVFVNVEIPSAPASSQAWRGREATPPDLPCSKWHEREMAGAAQADRAGAEACGGAARCRDLHGIAQFAVLSAARTRWGLRSAARRARAGWHRTRRGGFRKQARRRTGPGHGRSRPRTAS